MLIDHSHGLHEGVTDRRADEAEAVLLQVFAHGVALGSRCRDTTKIQWPPPHHFSVGELPDVFVEASRPFANLQVRLSVADEGVHLEPVPHDAGIEQQPFALGVTVACHFLGVEIIEGSPVGLALAQDGEPAQTRLGPLET